MGALEERTLVEIDLGCEKIGSHNQPKGKKMKPEQFERWWDDYIQPDWAAGSEERYRFHIYEHLQVRATPGSRIESLERKRQEVVRLIRGFDIEAHEWPGVPTDAVNDYIIRQMKVFYVGSLSVSSEARKTSR